MNIRASALIGLLALFCVTAVAAEEPKSPQPGFWSGMMGQGWGNGMMGRGQGYGPGMMRQGYDGGPMGGCGMMGGGSNSYVDGRIAFLEAELKITAAQKAAWTEYADALRSNSQIMASMHKQMAEAFRKDERSAMKFLDFHIQAMKSRIAALEALKPATEALYKVLTEEQRKKADDLIPVMGCM
ncbi:MAG: Spy/CpxP family protein refolding chaperone [Parvibaculum sp.]|uniref:Spy/CpxP family protein refolding chaperone n=1 Tax=Parvibaculum sp. TaxID=2024848 RepID=UPI003C75C482